MYWILPPSLMIGIPWGIVSVKRGVARKSCYFTKNVNFAYIKHIHFVQKSSFFISLMTKIFHFLMYWTLLPSIKIRIPWDIILIRQVLPEIHAFYLKWQFCLGPMLNKYNLDSNHQCFTSLMTSILYSFMFWTSLPRLWSAQLWELVQWMVVLPENHAFLPKCHFWLSPIAEYVHFRQKSVFYKFDDTCVVFLHVLDLSPSIMIRKPWGTGSVNDEVARKSCLFT